MTCCLSFLPSCVRCDQLPMRAAKFEVSDESVGDMRLKDGTIVPQVSQKHGSQTPPSMRCKVLCSCFRHLNLIGCTGVGGSILHIDEGSKTHRSGETIADMRLKQSTIVPQVSQKTAPYPPFMRCKAHVPASGISPHWLYRIPKSSILHIEPCRNAKPKHQIDIAASPPPPLRLSPRCASLHSFTFLHRASLFHWLYLDRISSQTDVREPRSFCCGGSVKLAIMRLPFSMAFQASHTILCSFEEAGGVELADCVVSAGLCCYDENIASPPWLQGAKP